MNHAASILIAGIAVATAAGFWAFRSTSAPNAATLPAVALSPAGTPAPTGPAALHPGSFRAHSDHVEIFRRAFWRRPAPDDTIRHAEARQWADPASGDVLHWQWFIAVEASPGLHAWLRDTNPFSLRPAKSLALPSAPSWFPADAGDFEVFRGGAGGSLVMAYSRTGRTVYAAASGSGLSRAVEPPRPKPAPNTAAAHPTKGRLPYNPPPNPGTR